MSGHTKGRWRVYASRTGSLTITDGHEHIAAILTGGRIDTAAQEANANLIAAAPEMLAVLKLAMEARDDDRSWEGMALAAIAKAEGGEP